VVVVTVVPVTVVPLIVTGLVETGEVEVEDIVVGVREFRVSVRVCAEVVTEMLIRSIIRLAATS